MCAARVCQAAPGYARVPRRRLVGPRVQGRTDGQRARCYSDRVDDATRALLAQSAVIRKRSDELLHRMAVLRRHGDDLLKQRQQLKTAWDADCDTFRDGVARMQSG